MTYLRRICGGLALLLGSAAGHAEPDIVNYVEYSPSLSSSGQPTAAQIGQLSDEGFERVVYLAFTDHESSLANEDRLVRSNGLQFAQVPVVWQQPTPADFELFSAVMQQSDARTLVHCQINWRASSFTFLHRVVNLGVPIADAKLDLDKVWVPQPHWRDFIFTVLEANGIDPNCELCDWDKPSEMNH